MYEIKFLAMRSIKFFILLFLLVLSSCAKDIVDLTCSIEGVVKDKDTGVPLTNCEIQITPSNNSVTTANNGVYSFKELEPGEYTLTYSRSGYITDSRTVSVNAGETSKIEMLLKAKASFSLSENVYDFGDLESNKTFICFNNSASDCSYTISNLPEWILVNKTYGTVKANSNDSFILTIDRSKVGIGTHSQNIMIEYSGKETGTETLLIRMSKVELSTPTVNTAYSATSVTEYSFNIEGTITATGGAQITSYGHCWSTTENPTINDQCTNLGMTEKIGAFKSTIEGLLVNTTYYVRAYATNSQGTSYGEQTIVKTMTKNSDIWNGQIASSFAGGSGSVVDPYIIKTGGQLLLMKEYGREYFKLDNDINLNNNNWLPIEFGGYLNGNGHTIYNLKITRNVENQGLFSELSGTVENLRINGVDIQASQNSNIGALAGSARDAATVKNCEVFVNTILGMENVGGLIGYYYGDLNVNNCIVNGTDKSTIKGVSKIGGIIGNVDNYYYYDTWESKENHAIINIEGESCIGGCYGYIENNIKLYNHSFNGNIKGANTIGGICGCIEGTVSHIACKANVNIEAYNSKSGVGGIIGDLATFADYNTIICCYSTGAISSNGSFGGIVDPIVLRDNKEDLSFNHCYTTIHDDWEYEGYNDCISVYETDDLSETMFEYYSKYAQYWNFNNNWNWNGEVNGVQVSIKCPRLYWE